ncbi:MAG: LPS export ABC transporter periplasmic protein LptC [Bacteroidales bacterium]|nr:LPS export ABC transporter periplasmic protein LptC [Bacteroidales bacterium]MDD2424824.1 LPS export ABC transporter periplasmic protein LptC [Bacteroidales bacterium]MDD3990058.1 LPS export ABC transporter periplasmic protein LptC [Bacteroidales bacterium]
MLPDYWSVKKRVLGVAVTFVIATAVFSCKEHLPVTGSLVREETPTTVVEDMTFTQTNSGIISMWVTAPRMERYSEGEEPYDLFPMGINVKAYNYEGALETEITSRFARHKTARENEIWEAYGNVVVQNYIKGERMETDTLFWDRKNQKIFTHTMVRLTTPDLFMQGFGMESDEMARNAKILKPFDSYAIVARDSTEGSYIDSVNFIGPLLPLKKQQAKEIQTSDTLAI